MGKSSSITFVSAFMNIYDTPYQNKDVEWRFRHFKKIAQTGIQLVLFCSHDCKSYMDLLIEEYPNIKVIKYIDLSETWTYKLCGEVEATIGQPLALPNSRTIEKDTREYIILMNAKTEYLKMAIDENHWASTHFAWIDFNIYHIFQGREQYVNEYLKAMSMRTMAPYFLTLPGCWGKEHVHEEFLINDICWRFCGGFFIGSADRILEFHKCYQDHFEAFLISTKKLVWEVNFWAYLELRHGLSVIWYQGDHNERILEISVKNMAMRLADKASCKHIRYDYPLYDTYIPTSTSYLYHKDKHIINTRYVNYWLYPNGAYSINDPDHYIRTRNFCSILDDTTLLPYEIQGQLPIKDDENNKNRFIEMSESFLGLPCCGGHIYGLEDIRLYAHNDEIHFIATSINYSGLGRNRMVTGVYDIDLSLILSAKVLVPPDENSWCEKNWIPLPKKNGSIHDLDMDYNMNTEQFIYKWNPLEIGSIDNNKLVIHTSFAHNAPLFSNIRGSTPLIEYVDGFLGVVHFSYEGSPRTYFHMLVLLDKNTYKPLKYSEFFYFNELSIEFCIGFMIRDDTYHFWLSNFDRDPELLTIPILDIPLLFDFTPFHLNI